MAKKPKNVEETGADVTAAAETVATGPKMAKRVDGILPESVLTVVTTVNPKREGSQSYDRFQGYFDLAEGATVKDALDKGLTMGDIRYDVIHGYIEIADANVTEYEVTPRGEKAVDADITDTDTAGDDNGFN